MKRLIDKVHSKLREQTPRQPQQQQEDTSLAAQLPSPLDIVRYRYHHGVNLGGIFVLEKWLYPSMFDPSAEGDSELDAIIASLRTSSADATLLSWQTHWATAISDSAIAHLAQTLHVTTVRLPIGYFTLPPFLYASTPTPFSAPNLTAIYAHAYPALLALIHRLHMAGIAVLLDMHALPGGANTDAHSGTSSHRADLWTSAPHRAVAKHCVSFLATEIRDGTIPSCAGIQLCNEAAYDAPGLYAFYDECRAAVTAIDPTIPIYISDAWHLAHALSWSAAANTLSVPAVAVPCPIVVDTHRYYTFTDADRAQTPHDIIARIPHELHEAVASTGDVVGRGAVATVVGEWSCALDTASWARVSATDKADLIQAFGHAQQTAWQSRSAGAFFWTATKERRELDGGEWDFSAICAAGAVTAPDHLTLSVEVVRARLARAASLRDGLKTAAVAAHVAYWQRTAPAAVFEHRLFGAGWDVGWADTVAFFGVPVDGRGSGYGWRGADRIGAVDLWLRKRAGECGGMGGERGRFVWEWEHGFRQANTGAERVLVFDEVGS